VPPHTLSALCAIRTSLLSPLPKKKNKIKIKIKIKITSKRIKIEGVWDWQFGIARRGGRGSGKTRLVP
jgi:hypothetical protein